MDNAAKNAVGDQNLSLRIRLALTASPERCTVRWRFLLLVIFFCCRATPGEGADYGVARGATPVLATAAFSTVFGGRDGMTLKTDRCGLVRELEFIALGGTVFRILAEVKGVPAPVYRVETNEYPAPAGRALYVDSRFIEPRTTEPPQRPRKLPAAREVIASLMGAMGNPYVWGGNLSSGVPELAGRFYRNVIPDDSRNKLLLAGVDCSGLLYQATNGWTPRNTSELVTFGRGLAVAGATAAELAGRLQPLDLIVWNGHVIIVLDRETAIESRLVCGKPGNGGVVTTPLAKRLAEVMRTRRPVDAWPEGGRGQGVFVVRRWYGTGGR